MAAGIPVPGSSTAASTSVTNAAALFEHLWGQKLAAGGECDARTNIIRARHGIRHLLAGQVGELSDSNGARRMGRAGTHFLQLVRSRYAASRMGALQAWCPFLRYGR